MFKFTKFLLLQVRFITCGHLFKQASYEFLRSTFQVSMK